MTPYRPSERSMNIARNVHPWRYWLLAWLLGATLLYFMSWPARLYRLADEAVRAASSDGIYLATQHLKEDDPKIGIGAPRERDAQLLIRNASSGRLYRSIETDSVSISSVEFANDNKYIVAQCDNNVVAWEVSSGKQKMLRAQGHLHSVVDGSDQSQWAAILLSDDLSNAGWSLRYNGVAFVEIATGKTISTLQPVDLHKGPWDIPGLAIAPDGQRAVTLSRVNQEQQRDDTTLRYTLWDVSSGAVLGDFTYSGEVNPHNADERLFPRAWTISLDSNKLWIAFGEGYGSGNTGAAYLHAYDLESLQLEKRIVDETTPIVIQALGNAYKIALYSDQMILVETFAGKALLKMSDESLACVAIDGMEGVISPDGSLCAKEAGEIVDAAPPFAYRMIDRRLSVVRISDGVEVASVSGPTGEVTSQSLFDPLGFTSDNRFLVYERYLDSSWGQVRATLSDLVNFRIPKINYRPIELRCLEMRTGRSRLVGMPERAPHLGEMLSGDRLRRGYEVWAVPGRKPWLAILLLPLLPLLSLIVVHRWWMRRDRRSRSAVR